jgi:hypothetical protein
MLVTFLGHGLQVSPRQVGAGGGRAHFYLFCCIRKTTWPYKFSISRLITVKV